MDPLFDDHVATIWVTVGSAIMISLVGAIAWIAAHFFASRPRPENERQSVDGTDRRSTVTCVAAAMIAVAVTFFAGAVNYHDFPGIVGVASNQQMPYFMLASYAIFLVPIVYSMGFYLHFSTLFFTHATVYATLAVQWVVWYIMLAAVGGGWQATWVGAGVSLLIALGSFVGMAWASGLSKLPVDKYMLIAANYMPLALILILELLITLGVFFMTTAFREWSNFGLTAMYIYHGGLFFISGLVFIFVFWLTMHMRAPEGGAFKVSPDQYPQAFLTLAYSIARETFDRMKIAKAAGFEIDDSSGSDETMTSDDAESQVLVEGKLPRARGRRAR